ncbi:MAG: long-chain fatty acid--CoA ligase [Candidatus Sericytochromatia bacterium]|nr:long-chain fatty acid--CoA ligase [Candidatus Sericytochromatia bacterium]
MTEQHALGLPGTPAEAGADPHATTLPVIFRRTVDRQPDAVAMAHKMRDQWQTISYRSFLQQVDALAAALVDIGILVHDRVCLLSANRPEWLIADQAILATGAANVPIYPTLTAPQIRYLLQDSGARALFVSDPVQYAKVVEVASETPQLAHIVLMSGEAPAQAPITTETWAAFLARGEAAAERTRAEREARLARITPEDTASIIYTSGTTGEPKGAMLTHRNIVSNHETIIPLVDIRATDANLSFLPLSHVFERVVYYAFISAGARINFAESIEKVRDNLAEVCPTFLVSVPRVLEKIRAGALDKAEKAPPLRRRIFHWAFDVARTARTDRERLGGLSPFTMMQLSIADKLVFSKIRAVLGGRLRYCISGGAPLSKEVAEFFELVGIVLLEGYGLTETSPVISCNTPVARRLGTVGKPIDGVEVHIAEDGEILARGPNIMKGYFNKPEETAKAIDPDGWFHTGDIGSFDEDGFLRITDRKKEILVMSNGKNVAPAPIENALLLSPYIAQACVLGDNRNFIAAILVPNFANLVPWATKKGLPTEPASLAGHPEVRALIQAEVARQTQSFARFEQIKQFTLLAQEFSIETGELTPKLSLKRRVILERHASAIERMYEAQAPVEA